jgi:hypothetical protein
VARACAKQVPKRLAWCMIRVSEAEFLRRQPGPPQWQLDLFGDYKSNVAMHLSTSVVRVEHHLRSSSCVRLSHALGLDD